MGTNKRLLRIWLITGIVSLIVGVGLICLAKFGLAPKGDVITQKFAEDYCRSYGVNRLGNMILLMIVASLFGILSAILWDRRYTAQAAKIELLFAIFGTAAIMGLLVTEGTHMLLRHPRVETATTVGTSEISNRTMIVDYYFKFSNDSRCRVSRAEYKHFTEGKTYYLIMDGDDVIGHFSSGSYRSENI